jgi:hypothetical protein
MTVLGDGGEKADERNVITVVRVLPPIGVTVPPRSVARCSAGRVGEMAELYS